MRDRGGTLGCFEYRWDAVVMLCWKCMRHRHHPALDLWPAAARKIKAKTCEPLLRHHPFDRFDLSGRPSPTPTTRLCSRHSQHYFHLGAGKTEYTPVGVTADRRATACGRGLSHA